MPAQELCSKGGGFDLISRLTRRSGARPCDCAMLLCAALVWEQRGAKPLPRWRPHYLDCVRRTRAGYGRHAALVDLHQPARRSRDRFANARGRVHTDFFRRQRFRRRRSVTPVLARTMAPMQLRTYRWYIHTGSSLNVKLWTRVVLNNLQVVRPLVKNCNTMNGIGKALLVCFRGAL